MNEWVGLALDVVLITLVGIGIFQATRLINQLRDLRAGRVEMERFVRDFNAAVMRAEAGIKGLRSAARETGDDLEKLVEKGVLIRDELSYIIESADSVSERLSVAAAAVLHTDRSHIDKTHIDKTRGGEEARKPQTPPSASGGASVASAAKGDGPVPSRAEKELLQALQKMK